MKQLHKNIFALLVLGTYALSTSAAQLQPENQRVLAVPYQVGADETAKWNDIGDFFGTCLVVFQVAAFVLMVQDIFSRALFKKPLKFIVGIRFIIVIFAAVVPWFIGSPLKYRNSGPKLDAILTHWFEKCYNVPGGAERAKIFDRTIDQGGLTVTSLITGYFNYVNVLFYPLIIFYIIYFTKKTVEFMGLIEQGNIWANLIGMVEWIYAFGMGFPFAGWGLLWIKQFFRILKYNHNNEPNIDMWEFSYILGWLVALPTYLIINWDGVIGIWFVAADYVKKGGKNEDSTGKIQFFNFFKNRKISKILQIFQKINFFEFSLIL